MGWHMRESSLAASQRAAITMVSRNALSHAQDGGRVHVLAARRAARMRSPWLLLNFTVKNHSTGVWCNVCV